VIRPRRASPASTAPSPGWARALLDRCRALITEIDQLTAEISALAEQFARTLVAIPGCEPLTATKILGETAGVDSFKSKDSYARHNGTAPLPVWSANTVRHRLARTGNSQLNAALHRIAMTQARCYLPARTMMDRRRNRR
jgi:transposase